MPALDIVFCALIMLAWPIYAKWFEWPRFRRSLERDARHARLHEFRTTIVQQWVVAAVAAFIWLHQGRSWESIGMRPMTGWRLWGSVALVCAVFLLHAYQTWAIEKSAKVRASARKSKSITALEPILPHTDKELSWFLGVSMTAGICEEFVFRGYLIGALAPVLGWWGAAAAALIPFGLLHGYQGRSGIIKTTIVGAFMTLIVYLTHSLIPAMVLHVIIDIGGGVVTYSVLRPRRDTAPAASV